MNVAGLLDRGVAAAMGLKKIFSEGWGDPDLLAELIERTSYYDEPSEISIRWRNGHQRLDGLHLFEGYFPSPDMKLPLPPESRTAYFQLLLPEDAFEGELPPVCVHLAGSGDATYAGRRTLSAPLARDRGIGSMLLMNPYYGERAPAGQFGTRLRTVVDQFTMSIAMIEEARSMMRWLREDGYELVGLTGYSMGGYTAALASQTVSFPHAAVPCAAPDTATAPIVDSPLSAVYDWRTLDAQLSDGESARALMTEMLDQFAVSNHGTLEYPELAVLVGMIRDAFVPPQQVMRLHRHWPGSELQWADAGHTTGWALEGPQMRDAVVRAFDRLAAFV